MANNNGGNDFFSGFDNVNCDTGSTSNKNDDFFNGFDNSRKKSKGVEIREPSSIPAFPTSSDNSTPPKAETEKNSLSHFMALVCICLVCVGGFAYKSMGDSTAERSAPPSVQEKQTEKTQGTTNYQAVSYKQFQNDKTGIVFEYPSTCSFDTVGLDECRFKIEKVAEVSVGKNTEPVMWDADIEYNMRRIKGDRTVVGENISSMQKISENSCLWQGKTKLGCSYITKSYFVTSASDGKITRYDMVIYFPQVGYVLDSDPKTKEMVQYMLGSYRVAPPVKQVKENEPSKISSSSTVENARTQLPKEQANPQSTQTLPYKTFRNDAIGYSFEYPTNATIDEIDEIGLRFKLTKVVKISVGRNGTNIWNSDMEYNIKIIKEDARIYRDKIKQLQQISENGLLIYGTDKYGMNYIEKAYFIENPKEKKVERFDMIIYCDWQGYELDSEPQVKEIVQHMLDSYSL